MDDSFRLLGLRGGPVVITLSPTGAMTSPQPAWHAATDQPEAEAQGEGWLSRLHPEDRERFRQALREMRHSHIPWSVRGRLRIHTGAYQAVTAHAAPSLGQDGEAHAWTLILVPDTPHDQTNDDQTNDDPPPAKNPSRQHAAVLLESLAHGVIAMDADGRITYVNAAFERVMRRKRGDLIGQDVWQTFPETVGQLFFYHYYQTLSTQTPQEFETYYEPLRMWIEAHVSPTPDGVVAYLMDITERKRKEEQQTQVLERERAQHKLAQTIRTAAEAARMKAERESLRLRRIMNSRLIGVMITDNERIIEANDELLRIIDYTRAEVEASNLTWPQLSPPEYARRDAAALAEILARGECEPYEKEYIRKDGSRIPVVIGAALIDPASAETVALVMDLTTHKRLESELAVRAGQLEATIEAMADAMLIYDTRGAIVRINEAGRDMFGIQGVQTPISIPLLERVRAEVEPDLRGQQSGAQYTLVDRALHGEMITADEAEDFRIYALNGQARDISATAAPIRQPDETITGAVVICRDVTARSSMENALRTLNERLVETSAEATRRAQEWQTIIDTIADGVIVYDRASHVTQINQVARAIMNLGDQPLSAFANFTYKEWRDTYNLRDSRGRGLTASKWPVTRVLRGATLIGATAEDILARMPTGADIVLNVSGAPLRDERGEITGAVFVVRDVTDRRALEQERLEMLNTVAHEISTPLSSVSLLASELDRGARLSPSRATRIQSGISRMKRLVSDLRDAVHMERAALTLERQPTDLCALCEQVTTEQQALQNHEVKVFLPEHPVHAEVDATRISQTLSNLISNAIKYGPPHTPVTVRLLEEPDAARIEVHDEGPGIPPSIKAHVFERFYRAPEAKAGGPTGLGLGLYICHRIIDQHGGQIDVESEPGHGSTFWLRLPLHPPAPPQPSR